MDSNGNWITTSHFATKYHIVSYAVHQDVVAWSLNTHTRVQWEFLGDWKKYELFHAN